MAAGMSTLPMAMAAPTITVPASSAWTAGPERTRTPTASSASATLSRRCIPIRRVSAGVQNAKIPNANTGMVVSRLVVAVEMPSEDRICVTRGLTDATAIRRFSAMANSPAARTTTWRRAERAGRCPSGPRG